MNQLRTFLPPGDDSISRRKDLLANVSHLVECLSHASQRTPGASAADQHEAAERAISAAIEAESRIAQQLERIAHLEQLAITDELTGLLNRRGFQSEMRRALAAARRYEENGILVCIDLDGFKLINDTYGHAAGDEVLRNAARVLKDNVRDTDYVGRLGGDEFGVLLTRTTWERGLTRAESLDRLLNTTFVNWQGRIIALHASLGFQSYGPDDDECQILDRADDAMYRRKRLRTAPLRAVVGA